MSETGIEEWETAPNTQHHPEAHPAWKAVLWIAAGVALYFWITT